MRQSQITETVENLDSIDVSGQPFLHNAIVHLKSCWDQHQMADRNERYRDLLLALGESVFTYEYQDDNKNSKLIESYHWNN